MSRILLRLANAPAFLLLACILVSIQSALFISFPVNWLQPDLILALVIWAALKRGFIEGGILTLMMGHLLEIHSSAPQGIFLSTTMAVYLGVRLAARILVLPDFQAWIRLTIVASLGSKVIGLLVLSALDKAELQWRHTLVHLFPDAVLTAIAGSWLYRLLDKLDRHTHKDARLEQRLTDDLKLAENEAI